MVRFSCFQAHTQSNKPKKTVQLSVEAMQKALQDCSEKNRAIKDFTNSSGLKSIHVNVQGDDFLSNGANHVKVSSSVDRSWQSDKIIEYDIESDVGAHQTRHIKKSISLGSGLDQEGKVSGDNELEDEIDQGFSCDGYHDHDGLAGSVGCKEPGTGYPGQYQEALHSDSVHVSSDFVNNESIFSIGDAQQYEKEQFSGESSDHVHHTPTVIVKSSSLPNLSSSGGRSALTDFEPHSRSFEDLRTLDLRQKEMIVHEERDDCVSINDKIDSENPRDGYDSYNYVGSAKEWIIPVIDEVNEVKNFQGESSARQLDDLPNKDLKIKRIEEWVINLQHCGPLDETNELSDPNDYRVEKVATKLDYFSAAKLDVKVTPGMEAAKKYISSLSATATTAQLANHGLVVIPFVSAFVSLRALNLSGNAIVRITAGALPRGLHILNLSKNNISTIEGLRELTRVRVLDLSYNRIVRIGHGLASCSSLKELYLAGNKISEVEGLHRLLKLNVLDLRFNKFSTAKCLGQLAANYNSLQAISLEGNPAQKNVGDEQLKKYLQGLLPHLSYFNRQSIKAGTLKDASDRSARLGIGAHPIDRGLRSEHKGLRKASHGRSKDKAVVSPKQSKARHGRLPPSGTKTTTTHRDRIYDFSSKLASFRPELSMRRSRSEGTLAAI